MITKSRGGGRHEAAEKAQEILPDVILLDMMMPEKDGLQVCRELRAYTPTAEYPDHFADGARGRGDQI